jgi:hypothetical protein
MQGIIKKEDLSEVYYPVKEIVGHDFLKTTGRMGYYV